MFRKRYRIFILIFLPVFAGGCLPVNSSFESARMLQPGQFQAGGNFSRYFYEEKDEKKVFKFSSSNNNYTAAAGYGISDKWNVKLRYDYIDFPGTGLPYNYFGITPKYSLIQNKLAAELSTGMYAAHGDAPTYVTSPELLVTISQTNTFETTFTGKADFYWLKNQSIPLGFTFGFGFSSNLDKWAVRPETGVMFSPGKTGVSFTWGIGFQYNFYLHPDK